MPHAELWDAAPQALEHFGAWHGKQQRNRWRRCWVLPRVPCQLDTFVPDGLHQRRPLHSVHRRAEKCQCFAICGAKQWTRGVGHALRPFTTPMRTMSPFWAARCFLMCSERLSLAGSLMPARAASRLLKSSRFRACTCTLVLVSSSVPLRGALGTSFVHFNS